MEINSNYGEAMNYSLTLNTSDGNTGFYVGDPNLSDTETPAIYHNYPVYDYYWNWWYPNCEVRYEKSKVDMAFRILKVLGDKKIIDMNKLTVGKFINLVNDLAKEL